MLQDSATTGIHSGLHMHVYVPVHGVCVCVCVCAYVHTRAARESETNFQDSDLSFYHMGPGEQTSGLVASTFTNSAPDVFFLCCFIINVFTGC